MQEICRRHHSHWPGRRGARASGVPAGSEGLLDGANERLREKLLEPSSMQGHLLLELARKVRVIALVIGFVLGRTLRWVVTT